MIRVGIVSAIVKKILDSRDSSDLTWYFCESHNALGYPDAHGDSAASQSEAVSKRIDALNAALPLVKRERDIRKTVARMPVADRSLLALYYGPRIPSLAQFYGEFGQLAPIVHLTYTAQRETLLTGDCEECGPHIDTERVRRTLGHMFASRQQHAEKLASIKRDAEAMLESAQSSYLQSQSR